MTDEVFLEELLGAVTVSGYEEEGQAVIRKYMEPLADEVRTDDIGDTVCVLGPDRDFRILMTAHLDEIGLMVTTVNEQGRLQVIDRGGIVPATYPGHRVKVMTERGPIYGVVESYRDFFKKEGGLKTSDFLIDIGVDSKEEAYELVEPGAPVVLDTGFCKAAGGRFLSRALDDRLGVFIIMEAFKKARKRGCACGVYSAATVGEETTKNGAYWTASRVKPDLAVVVDVTYTSDCIGMNAADSGEVTLGGGPVLCNSPIVSKRLNRMMRECASRIGVKVQTEAASRLSYTDADKIHFAGEGIPTVLVSIPLRYMHHPAEMADEKDVEGCIDLIAEFLVSWGISGRKTGFGEPDKE